MKLIDADALKAKWYKLNDIDENDRGARFVGYTEIARLIDEAPTIVPSADTKFCGVNADQSADQNVADVPIGDTISREDAIKVVMAEGRNVYASEYANAERIIHEADAVEALAMLPPADRQTDESCQDCPLYDSDNHNCPRFNKVIPQTRKELTAETVHKPDYSYEADMVRRLKEEMSADRPKFKLELITEIVRQLRHLDDYVADTCDRPQVNSNSAEEQIAEICDRPKGEWIDNPQPYVPEASTERVVHCKDCVYSRQPEEELFVCENRFGMSGWVRENEFCSSGSL